MLAFFKEAFRRNKRAKDAKGSSAASPLVVPNLPILHVTRIPSSSSPSSSGGGGEKVLYSQPPNPDHDAATNTLTLRSRRALRREEESFIAITNPEMLLCPVDFAAVTDEAYLDAALVEATAYASRVPSEGYVFVSDLLRLTFYVYFKQATEGDITDAEVKKQPYVFQDWEGYWKVFGWKRIRGMAREEARDKYVSLLNETVSTRADFAWAPAGYEEDFLKSEQQQHEGEGEGKEDPPKKKKSSGTTAMDREVENQRWTSFFEAVRIVRNFPKRPYQLPDHVRARLYGLYKQATVGDLASFQKSEACLTNPHYSWCRARPADDAADRRQKEKNRKDKINRNNNNNNNNNNNDAKLKKNEKQSCKKKGGAADDRATTTSSSSTATTNTNNNNINDTPGKDGVAGILIPADPHDLRSFDQLRYDEWSGWHGTDRCAAIRQYLTYFYRVGAAHGYVWDPPGSAAHMPEVGNQFTSKEKAELLKERGLDGLVAATLSNNSNKNNMSCCGGGAATDSTSTGGMTTGNNNNNSKKSIPVRKAARPTAAEDFANATAVVQAAMAAGEITMTAEEAARAQRSIQKAVVVDEEGTRERIEREEAERERRRKEKQQKKAATTTSVR